MSKPTNKVHISLNVANLQASVEFFGRVFGQYPTKMFGDYAKFDVENPPLVLSLEPKQSRQQPNLNHLGIRLESGDTVESHFNALAQRGIETQVMAGVQCCYSEQTKIALNDPDGNLWEVYTLDKDLETSHSSSPSQTAGEHCASALVAPTAPEAVYEHMLGTVLTIPFPHADHSQDHVILKGTFNAAEHFEKSTAILAESRRVLKPGGTLTLHLLVANKLPSKQLPKLPGPAALVDFTPVGDDIIKALEQAGFTALHCKRYSHTAVYRFDGCEMRELLIDANKPAEAKTSAQTDGFVIYKGPFKEISDDLGQNYVRGITTAVAAKNIELLKQGAYAESFVFIS